MKFYARLDTLNAKYYLKFYSSESPNFWWVTINPGNYYWNCIYHTIN